MNNIKLKLWNLLNFFFFPEYSGNINSKMWQSWIYDTGTYRYIYIMLIIIVLLSSRAQSMDSRISSLHVKTLSFRYYFIFDDRNDALKIFYSNIIVNLTNFYVILSARNVT